MMFSPRITKVSCLVGSILVSVVPLTVTAAAIATPAPSDFIAQKTKPMPSLEQTEWQLISLGGQAIPPKTTITAQFIDNRLTGSDGCNRYTTSYQTQGKTLQINSQIATTRRACPPEIMAESSRFLTSLGAVTQYRLIEGKKLEISYQNGKQRGVLVFVPLSSATQAMPLEGKTWYLTSLNGKPPLLDTDPSLEFKEGRLGGSGGCNRLISGYQIQDNKLTIDGQMASTMKACPLPIMEQESTFLRALAGVQQYLIDNRGNLQLSYLVDDKRGVLTFSAEPSAQRSPKATQTKTIYINAQTVDCTGVGPQKCWQIKEKLSDNWQLLYTPIAGFDYKPGYLYQVTIHEQAIANPPADASSIKRSLVKVLSQVPVLWLDRPLTNWNKVGATIPKAPQPQGDRPTVERCRSQVRPPTTAEDRAIVQAGWSLLGSVQSYGKTTLIKAMTGVDGMCRPLGYQVFVFQNGKFAGTLSPQVMDARSNGSERQSYLMDAQNIRVDYNRYGEADALCCASMVSQGLFKLEQHQGKPLVVPVSTTLAIATAN